MLSEKMVKICEFCLNQYDGDPLNMDDIDEIYTALKEFNGEMD